MPAVKPDPATPSADIHAQPRRGSTPGQAAAATGPAPAWRLLAEQAPMAMALLDRHLRYVAANRLWHQLLNAPLGRLVGRLHPEVVGAAAARWQPVLAQVLAGEARVFEESAPAGGARHQWVLTPQRDPQGSVVGLLVYCQLLQATDDRQQPATDPPPTGTLPPVPPEPTGARAAPEPALVIEAGSFERDPCPAVVLDASGTIVRLNTAAMAWRLRSPAEAAGDSADDEPGFGQGEGLPFWKVFADRPGEERMREALSLVLADGAGRAVELPPGRQPGGDGEESGRQRLMWSALALRDPAGAITGAYLQGAAVSPPEEAAGLVRERAQRRGIEQQLASLEEELASLQTVLEAMPSLTVLEGFEWLNAVPVAAAVIEGDTVRQWNRSLAALLGWPGNDHGEPGPRDLDAPPTIAELLAKRSSDERHRGQLVKQWRQLAGRGGSQVLPLMHPQRGVQELRFDLTPLEPALGARPPSQDQMATTGAEAEAGNGSGARQLLLVRDVTEDRREQAALRSAERRLRSVLHQLALPLLVTDAEGRIVDSNPAFERLSGRSRQVLARMEWKELLSADDQRRCVSVVRELDERGVARGRVSLRLLDESGIEGAEVGAEVVLVRGDWDQLQHVAYLFAGGDATVDGVDGIGAGLDRSANNRQIRNGLHIIHTLLDLQSHATSVGAAREVLKTSQNRVAAILEVFQDGCMDPEGRVSVLGLARSLADRLAAASGWADHGLAVEVGGDGDRLTLERVVPVALVINELVSHVIERAAVSGGSSDGRSRLALQWLRVDGGSKLRLAYEGPTREPAAPLLAGAGLGLRIAETLAEQLGGGVVMDAGPPLRFEVDLPLIGGQ